MRIGIICYAGHGGSGIVATELGGELAARGHEVHFITNDVPVRMQRYRENVFFHRVEIDTYPVFPYTPYSLSLAAKILDVIRHHGLDVIHAHYAVPHATSGWLAKEMCRGCPVKLVTTLHGTDITLVGLKPSYYEITRFSIERSDRVTAVSAWLRDRTYENFPGGPEIEVVHNFVDSDRFHPFERGRDRRPWAGTDEFVLMHASNFRAVKNVRTVVDVFAKVREKFPARLLMVGDGPELSCAEERVRQLALEASVSFLGAQEYLEDILPLADMFLLPSAHESFGLAALEAMSAGVACVATNVGGAVEIIRHGENGFLHAPEDVDGMAASIAVALSDPAKLEKIEREARATAVTRFGVERAVEQYLAIYESALAT
ncbi:MAG: N-acetyl-alpha-D-glucosaminyl L-malate synthase BshA [bacterium]